MAESGKTVSLWEILGGIHDPRDSSGRRFPLQGILALTAAALLSGRQGLSAIARWGRSCSRQQLAQLGIERPKSPCHATYHNVFKVLDVAEMERSLAEWAREALPPDAAAVDGKALRDSRQAEYPALQLLSAYCGAASGTLVRMPADGNQENEITAAAELLRGAPPRGRLVAGGAMSAQKPDPPVRRGKCLPPR